MSALSHPNLVKFYGIVRKPSLQLIMEYVPMGDLFSLLHPKIERDGQGDIQLLDDNRIPLPTRTTLPKESFSWRLRLLMAWDMAKGMHYLHSMDPPVVHRDLRSPNIFLVSLSEDPRQERAKVADFGMSRRVASPMQSALATFRWVAPETMSSSRRKTYDERSDIYSFGICCWEIATRQYPYDEYLLPDESGAAPMEQHQLLREIARGLRPSLPPSDEGCPEAFGELIRDCWQTEPEKRPPFAAIVERLEAMLDLGSTLLPSRVSRVTGLTASAEELKERQDEKAKTRRAGFIRIFDLSSPSSPETPVFAWKAHRSAVLFVTAVPAPADQTTEEVWSCSQDGSVCLWVFQPSVSAGAKLCLSAEPFGSLRAAFPSARSIGVARCVASSKSVWVASDTSPSLVQVLDRRCIEVLHVVGRFPDVTAVVSLSNGQTWIASSNRVLVFDTHTVELMAQWEAHEAPISALIASDEASGGFGWQSGVSSRTVWTGDASGRYQVWSVSGARISKEYDSGAVNAGSRICCAAQVAQEMWLGYDSGDVLVCSMDTFRPLHEIQAHSSAVTAIQAVLRCGMVVTMAEEEARTWEFTNVGMPVSSTSTTPSVASLPVSPADANASTSSSSRSATLPGSPTPQQPRAVMMGLQRRSSSEQSQEWRSAAAHPAIGRKTPDRAPRSDSVTKTA